MVPFWHNEFAGYVRKEIDIYERRTELGRRDDDADANGPEAPGSLDRFMTEGTYRDGILRAIP